MRLYMLVGLPGSGKSTWAENHKDEYKFKIISSDKIRGEMFGDESCQEDNGKIFQIMNQRTMQTLSEGYDVCYDATNISRKSRKSILSLINNSKDNIEVIAIVFNTPFYQCLLNNNSRSRKVPPEAIKRMMGQFEIPVKGEGIHKIIIIPYNESNSYSIYWSEAVDLMKGFDQENPNHSLDLFSHCAKCQDKVLSRNIDFDVIPELSTAALLHDYGKLFTKTFDSKKNYYHYYRHENIGAYKVFTEINFPDYLDRYLITLLINYHMEPYRLKNASQKKINFYKNQFGKYWQMIEVLHEGDVYAH